ncbi:SDR family NAD(P)-dependent oxidoreductase [Hutsoniella sourekii]|uniref:SDR family NAD(P)-dependent oxidoreductase n=1 Tax=Hutsoniella sourekii TaxID=87650 RepID=UPI000489EEFE|nr:SDR family oxidoreductase [Hutsoniella sourekii]
MKLKDKVAIVTGGTSGIGAATAVLFAQEGAKVVVVGRNEERGNAVVDQVKEAGSEGVFIQADALKTEDTDRVIQETVDQFGQIDILFNNAGMGASKPTEEVTFEEYRQTVAVDLDSVFYFAQQGILQMLKQEQGGVIVNTASMYGLIGVPGSAAYNAAKAGVINLTRSLGTEFADRKIRINAICPGYIDTPILPEESKQMLADATPMKRLGQSEEIAKAVLFLASDDSSFMTGSALVVDGGRTAG